MIVMLFFLAAVGAVIIWWMAGQRLLSRPWLEPSPLPVMFVEGRPEPAHRAARTGLYVFLGVVGALFSLFISAYFMRMAAGDNGAMPVVPMLWVNTTVLGLASADLQWAKNEAHQDRIGTLQPALVLGLLLACLFLVGQLQVWQEMAAAGYLLAQSAASSFFYLLTGLHGLHVLGGLLFLGSTTLRSFDPGASPAKLRLNIDLCGIYFHFMFGVWLVLFALFAGWASDMVDLCRQLLT